MTWDELRAEAFGEMGINPRDFYIMRFYDFILFKKGYFNKKVYEQRVLRRVVMTIIAPWLKSQPSPYSIFPIANDSELLEFDKENRSRISQQSLDVLRQFKEREKSQKPKEN